MTHSALTSTLAGRK